MPEPNPAQTIQSVFVGGPFTQAIHRNPAPRFDLRIRAILESIHRAVLDMGLSLLSSHVAENFGEETDVESVASRDLDWATLCDCYVAVLVGDDSGNLMRSDGTFVELGFCLALRKRILLVYETPRWLESSDFLRSLAHQPYVQSVSWQEFQQAPKQVLAAAMGIECESGRG